MKETEHNAGPSHKVKSPRRIISKESHASSQTENERGESSENSISTGGSRYDAPARIFVVLGLREPMTFHPGLPDSPAEIEYE